MSAGPIRHARVVLAVSGLVVVALFATITVVSKTAPPDSPDDGALVWHVETLDGQTVQTRRADEPINPASVVKVATTLWALERLGPAHRFETRFAILGSLDAERGLLDGDLLVIGDGDPDFHVENAYLVARELNRAGLREVTGSLRVNDRFWIGWEGGSARREKEPSRRAEIMARRLRDALDPQRQDAATRRALAEFADRRGFAADEPPSVVVRGTSGRTSDGSAGRDLVIHRSNPLVRTLKRFNSFSNNDIERFEATLGSAAELAAFLLRRWGEEDELRLSTLSGLGSNRMTARQVVRLLDDLRETCERQGLDVRNLLPVAGCDPGTLENFDALDDGAALVAKTGTLTTTDGGVAVLAGLAGTGRGEILFCVAAPRIHGRLAWARAEQERWLLELVDGQDGWSPRLCGLPLGYSDDRAEAMVVD